MVTLDERQAWVLYQDEDLLVINKPAGVLSVPDGYQKELPHLRSLLEPIFGSLWMVHRLDRETSGLMVLARSADSHRTLNASFRLRRVLKLYHCLVAPAPNWQEKTFTAPLSINCGRAHLTRVDYQKGKEAQTDCRVLLAGKSLALLECRLHSGYRHQIRAHLYHEGLWILGDTLYRPLKQNEEAFQSKTMLLHASQLGFPHPQSGEYLEFRTELPDRFKPCLPLR